MKERYHISGMTCSACSAHVEKAVNKLEAVEKASVNLLTETMDVEYDRDRLSREEIEAAVEKAGYGASLIVGGAGGRAGNGGRRPAGEEENQQERGRQPGDPAERTGRSSGDSLQRKTKRRPGP